MLRDFRISELRTLLNSVTPSQLVKSLDVVQAAFTLKLRESAFYRFFFADREDHLHGTRFA